MKTIALLNTLSRFAAVAALAASSTAFAADSTPAPSPAADKLSAARAEIKAERWKAAIEELVKVNDTSSADWNNLMGYSMRKAKSPDYPAAERYYNEALRIDPKHRGALEYSGELYLVLGDLPKAEERLSALDKACFLPCDEHKELKKAVAKFKANGNKYTP
ncbi:tetratricopeptide repeat protein [Aquincola sp. S2]|uniref:Tetratricopeptide repeat protein n=1 Tax=Pseudaquabacterium terrae TaxID=2732868 RepID=A0ABX2ENP0_9BURK|nr:tetratricopeptide repeat protein [Aquabacterium terrae]NRF70233.1 tetratricopeptide repeat protein [Aquabacterium terrae]